jgi:hypothetical protein
MTDATHPTRPDVAAVIRAAALAEAICSPRHVDLDVLVHHDEGVAGPRTAREGRCPCTPPSRGGRANAPPPG